MKMLLAYHGGRTARKEYHAGLLPLGLGYLAATLRRAGYAVTLANFTRLSAGATRRLLDAEQADVLGLSVFTHNRHESFRIAALARRLHPASFIVVGGPHANHLPEQILTHYHEVDAVATGEGEWTLLDLVEALRSRRPISEVAGLVMRSRDGIRTTAPRPLTMDLDMIPPPDFGPPAVSVDETAQGMYLLTSRGCPADCSFCDSPAFWGRRLRFHSPARVVSDLADRRDRLGLLYVSFRDDTFALHRGRALELLTAVRDADLGMMWDGQTRVNGVDPARLALMSQAGCHHLQYGIESGSPRMLELLAKGVRLDQVHAACRMTREAGLLLSIYLISGVPGEGDAEARETEALVRAILPHDGIVSPLAIFPGTPLHRELRAAGRFDDAIFLDDKRPALLAREDRGAVALYLRYQRLLASVASRARYREADHARFESDLGAHAPLFVRRAEAELAAGLCARARQTLERARKLHPEQPFIRLLSARLEQEAGNVGAARSSIRRLKELVPRSVDAARLEAEIDRGNRVRARA